MSCVACPHGAHNDRPQCRVDGCDCLGDLSPELTPRAAKAAARAMARTDPHAAEVKELDAEALAALLVRHYGNEAPEVLSRALELARAKVAAWG